MTNLTVWIHVDSDWDQAHVIKLCYSLWVAPLSMSWSFELLRFLAMGFMGTPHGARWDDSSIIAPGSLLTGSIRPAQHKHNSERCCLQEEVIYIVSNHKPIEKLSLSEQRNSTHCFMTCWSSYWVCAKHPLSTQVRSNYFCINNILQGWLKLWCT